jgi:hypothetical protein
MIEIKFRAWLPKGFFADKELCKMDYHVCVSYNGKMMGIEAGWDYQGDYDSAVLMQFTGIKDGKGRDVYGGDIIGRTTFVDKIVVWYKCGFYSKHPHSDMYWPLSLDEFDVVIGNIFENPELLNQ